MSIPVRYRGGALQETFLIWRGMRRRCANLNNPYYGGRGIRVCERWQNNFERFIFDMGVRPAGMSIDRIDNNRGYEPGNCRWATTRQQANNRRPSNSVTGRRITAFGETKTATEWARDPRCVLSVHGLRWRLKQGETPEKAITGERQFPGYGTSWNRSEKP